MKEQVTEFAKAAENFCIWTEGMPTDALGEARSARKLLIELLRCAIELPNGEPGRDAPEISDEEYQKIYNRFESLPFKFYSECFNPLTIPAEEPVTADLADDLADVWRDLKRGLLLYQAGHWDAAVWEWHLHFDSHWGHHATGALYALQTWLSANVENH
jgi:hypothetical protein